MKILVTSGGTKIPIDMVRDITNMSTGTFGTRIAEECLRKGHDVLFFRAEHSKSPMRQVVSITSEETKYTWNNLYFWFSERTKWVPHYKELTYKTFEQYERGLNLFIGSEKPDAIILAAAVSDYTVEKPFNGKVRSNDLLTIRLTSLPKIINKVKMWAPTAKLVGFKLLVNSKSYELEEAAKRSVVENQCDMVVANDLDDIKRGKHKVTLVFPKQDTIVYSETDKEKDILDDNYLARRVVEHVEKL